MPTMLSRQMEVTHISPCPTAKQRHVILKKERQIKSRAWFGIFRQFSHLQCIGGSHHLTLYLCTNRSCISCLCLHVSLRVPNRYKL